jgi:hypothetical protein
MKLNAVPIKKADAIGPLLIAAHRIGLPVITHGNYQSALS